MMAFNIVSHWAAIDEFPVQEIERTVGQMSYGTVVRTLCAMRDANYGSLAACCKALRAAGQGHARTFHLLRQRLRAICNVATDFVERPRLTDPTLQTARQILELIEGRSEHGRTNLLRAAHAGNLGRVRVLLNLGADVHAADRNGTTALICAAHEGHDAVVEVLLAAGANVNASCVSGTALIAATVNGRSSIVKRLLAANADLEAVLDGGNALQWGVISGELEVVQQLVTAKAKVKARDSFKRTAHFWAVTFGYLSIAQFLEESRAQRV
jgi:ankyrin repeat protein